jgi:hypothetical protein
MASPQSPVVARAGQTAEDLPERLPNIAVAAELIMSIAEACALSHRPLGLAELTEYTSMTDRSVREAIKASLWLRLIEPRDEKYVSSSSIRSEFPTGKEKKALLFIQYLQRKKSFVQFATFLDYGNDPFLACEKVRVLYQVDVQPQVILQLFGGWGRTAGILEGNNRSLRLKPEYHAPDLPTEYLRGLKEAMDSDMRASVFISRKLTDETFRLIPQAGIDRAVRALRGVGTDPRNSVEDAGELLEDFLRIKANNDNVSVTGANGIGGVLQALDEKLLGQNRITTEHKSLGEALNTLRIMSSHPMRAATGRRWELKQDSALEAVLLVLSFIRSVHEYDRTKTAIF